METHEGRFNQPPIHVELEPPKADLHATTVPAHNRMDRLSRRAGMLAKIAAAQSQPDGVELEPTVVPVAAEAEPEDEFPGDLHQQADRALLAAEDDLRRTFGIASLTLGDFYRRDDPTMTAPEAPSLQPPTEPSNALLPVRAPAAIEPRRDPTVPETLGQEAVAVLQGVQSRLTVALEGLQAALARSTDPIFGDRIAEGVAETKAELEGVNNKLAELTTPALDLSGLDRDGLAELRVKLATQYNATTNESERASIGKQLRQIIAQEAANLVNLPGSKTVDNDSKLAGAHNVGGEELSSSVGGYDEMTDALTRIAFGLRNPDLGAPAPKTDFIEGEVVNAPDTTGILTDLFGNKLHEVAGSVHRQQNDAEAAF